MALHIVLCCDQLPFIWGGAEALTGALAENLRLHGHAVDIVRIPFRWYPKQEILKGYLAWRLINLEECEGQTIDRVIALKFPSFVVAHPYKVTWLIQQFRQAYDLCGTPHSQFDDSDADTELRRTIHRIDTRTLGESRHIFTISRNVTRRLLQYNGLPSEPLYPPPALDGQFRNSGYGDYVLSVSRLNVMKRIDQLILAMGQVKTPVRCRIAGRGEELERLQRLARRAGTAERIDFLGFVSNEEILNLYAGALGVYYAPQDEDYGFATVEAMRCQKPVLTMDDSGEVLEFVEDGVTGCVVPARDPAAMAQRIDQLYLDRGAAERMGAAGQTRVSDITWDATIRRLLEA
jgi:glycosyltransferase involved in cell wall biosynthesis